MPDLRAYKGAFLTWLCLPVSLALFLFVLTGLITTAYHPEAPGIHLVLPRIILSGVGVLGYIFLSFRHAKIESRAKVWRNALELVILAAALWTALQVYAVAFPQSKMIRLSFQGQVYDIPRIYHPGALERNGVSTLNISICGATGEPFYAAPCSREARVVLSKESFISGFDASFALDEAGATYGRDDVVTDWGGAVPQPDGSFTFDVGGGIARYLPNSSNRIVRFAYCYKATRSCEVHAKTGGNVIRFWADAGDGGAASFWRDQETAWLTMFDGWKCATACDR